MGSRKCGLERVIFVRKMSNLNYLCFVDGLLEFASSDPSSFAHYQLVYAEEHKNANVQYLTLTDEEYDEMFPYEEDEE